MVYISSKSVLLRSGLCEAVCEQRHQWQMPKVRQMTKMPKIKGSCLFKMIAFHNFSLF
jgi:hypothetical protein